jgi:hypothetical protein
MACGIGVQIRARSGSRRLNLPRRARKITRMPTRHWNAAALDRTRGLCPPVRPLRSRFQVADVRGVCDPRRRFCEAPGSAHMISVHRLQCAVVGLFVAGRNGIGTRATATRRPRRPTREYVGSRHDLESGWRSGGSFRRSGRDCRRRVRDGKSGPGSRSKAAARGSIGGRRHTRLRPRWPRRPDC